MTMRKLLKIESRVPELEGHIKSNIYVSFAMSVGKVTPARMTREDFYVAKEMVPKILCLRARNITLLTLQCTLKQQRG